MTPTEQKLSFVETQLILNENCIKLLHSITDSTPETEADAIRSEITRKKALIDMLEQEKKAIA